MTYQGHADVQAALFDIDGTLTSGGRVWAALVSSPDVVLARKAWLYGTAFPHYMLSKMGLVNQAAFRDRWVRLMAWVMTGWSEAQVDAMCQTIYERALVANLREDVVGVLEQHKRQGHVIVLVSTMFERIVDLLAKRLGADAGLGSVLVLKDGVCAGKIAGETCSGERKVLFAQRYLSAHAPDISLDTCAAYADSRSDVPFLAGVGYPVAVYPDDAMREEAIARGWRVFENSR